MQPRSRRFVRRAALTAAFVAAAVTLLGGLVATEDAASRRTPLTLAFSMEPAPLRSCEPVKWSFQVTNRGQVAAFLRFRRGARADVALQRAGGTDVYRWSARPVFTQARWQRRIPARSTWRFALGDELRVAPGRYQLVARITAHSTTPPARLVVRRTVTVGGGDETCLSSRPGPPGASLAASSGQIRLAFGSFCWSNATVGICADIAVTPGFMAGLPHVAVRPGELLRVTFGFAPETSSAVLGPLHGPHETLTATAAGRELGVLVPESFEPPPEGALLSISATGSTASGNGQASYLAVLDRAP